MREPDFAGLRVDAENAVRQPDFAVVRRRAGRVRSRRAAATAAAALAVALAVGGLGYAATGAPGGDRLADPPTPSIGDDQGDGWPRITDFTAGAPGTVYAVMDRCRDCEPELYASVDGGGHWERRTIPPREKGPGAIRSTGVLALGPQILGWRDLRAARFNTDGSSPEIEPGEPTTPWISVDGGRSWRVSTVNSAPAAELPAGTRPVDCSSVDRINPCLVYAVDPASGRIAPLAHQPSGITVTEGWTQQVNASGERVWVPGIDPVTRKPAVAVSGDRGRTWRTHVFSDGLPGEKSGGRMATMYLPMVAAGAGGTAYALLYRTDKEMDAYRTVDGGATWQRLPGRVGQVPDPGLVTADGAHVVVQSTDTDTRVLASRDGQAYAPVTLSGYPVQDARQYLVSTVVPGLYLQLDWEAKDIYLSRDGWTWRAMETP